MKTRRTVLATVAAVAAVVSTLASGVVAAPATAATEVTCRAEVGGLTSGNKFLSRTVENGKVLKQKLTATSLPYRAGQMGIFSFTTISGGWRTAFSVIANDGRPRLLTVTNRDGSNTLQYSSKTMLNRNFQPRLFTNSGGYHVFALDSLNRLQRLTTYRDSRGNLSFGNQQLVLRRMGNLKTLSFYNRQKIAGVNTDLLYATTKAGALVQVRVPVGRPGSAKVVTIKRAGFAQYTELSLSSCGSDRSTAYIIAVNATDNLARSYVLARQAQPSAVNLTGKGLVLGRYSWKLHAVL